MLSRNDNGQFYSAPLDQPVQIIVGDEVIRDGNTITVIRGGQVVAVRTFANPQVAAVTAQADELVSSVVFFRSNPVAGQSVVITRVTEHTTNGTITFYYSNGSSVEYASWEAVGTTLGSMDQQPELAQQILAYKSYVNSPDGTNKTTMMNVNCAVNFQAGTPIALIEV